MFKFLSAEPEHRTRRFPFPESGKQPAGQPAAAVMVNHPIALVEPLCRCHRVAPNPHCLKGEAARALANKLLVFRHTYKLAQHGFPVNEERKGNRMTYQEKIDWLRKIFSNDSRVRAEAMSTEIPQPLFESHEDFTKALKELEHDRRRN